MLTELSIQAFAAKIAVEGPPPGGGSAAALSGLTGVSLLQMAVRLSLKNRNQEETSRLLARKADMERLQALLGELVNKDALAFGAVMSAFAMPQGTPAESSARNEALQTALQTAAEVPLDIARASLEVMEIGQVLLSDIDLHAVSDVMIAILAGHTGTIGALLNTAINLGWLKDKALTSALKGQMHLLRTAADELKAAAEEQVYSQDLFKVMRA